MKESKDTMEWVLRLVYLVGLALVIAFLISGLLSM